MAYQRLPYEQYFIDNSEDYNHTGKARREIHYRAVGYHCNELEERLGLHHEVNFEIFYEADRDVIQINFQKTNGRSDWFANIAEFSSRYYDAIDFEGKRLRLRTHHGWAEMYKTIKREVRQDWLELHTQHPQAATEIIGWSLGSGQAILCAQDLNYNYGVKPYLYTFGSVRPFKYTLFNRKLMERYLSGICSECRNFANINDLVTYMPPFRGFVMPERWSLGKGRVRLSRLLNPNLYHTIYDRTEFYQDIP